MTGFKKILSPILFTLIVMFFSCEDENKIRNKPAAVNGILDLRDWDFQKHGIAELKGEWKFRWMEDKPEFSAENYDDSAWDTLDVPGSWNSKTGAPYGTGWARLKILISPESAGTYADRLSIEQIQEIFSAYAIYVNGKREIQSGKIFSAEEGEYPDHSPVIKPLLLDYQRTTITVAVRMSNYNFVFGGFHGAPAIGLSEVMNYEYYKDEAKNYIVLGVILMMIIYHLFLWMARRDDMSSLVFAFFCLAPLCRVIYVGNISAKIFSDFDYYNIHHKFSFAAIPLLFIFTPTFFAILFTEEFSRKILRFFQISGIALLTFIILTSVKIFSRFMLLYEIILAVMLIWVIISIIKAFINKKNEAWLILAGMVIVFAAVINDLLFSFGTINTGFYSQAGFIILIFCQSTALSLRFARTYKTAEHLTGYLKDEVDRKTSDLTLRTKEAEDAKHEIENANKMLMEMDNYKNLFFQNITHEFRTPLTLIIGYIERTLDTMDDINPAELSRQYNIVLSNARRLHKLINQILDISKIDARMMRFKEEPADIIGLIKNIMLAFESVAHSKKIEFTGEYDSESLYCLFDREKIEKIIYNLLSNAFKFTDKDGKIKVTITSAGENVILSVKDTRSGIDESMLPKIFDRFYQADNTMTRNYEGTGIGLSIVKEYVEMHNGAIEVQSVTGSGTTFILTLPLKKIEPEFIQHEHFSYAVNHETASMYISDFASDAPGAGVYQVNEVRDKLKSILIVDDNSDIRRYIKDILITSYNIIEAENGIDGMEKVINSKPDLVISDIMMPKMDGYQLLKEIKNNTHTAQTPVILLTAKADEIEKVEGLDAGADDYLTKPFSSKELRARVKSLIKLYQYQKMITHRNVEIEADLDIARIIQSKLMLDGYRAKGKENFSVIFYPLDKVAGDFYNYLEDEETVKIFIADVSGHGVASAFLALITKNELDNTISQMPDTVSVLNHLNETISRYSVKCNFVTAFYCIYFKKSNKLKYSRAGHNPPLLHKVSDNSIIELSTFGRALGFFPDIKFEEKEISLQAGDRIIFYTDGLIETCNKSGVMFGIERLTSFLAENRHFPPDELTGNLMKSINDFTEAAAFDDDVTLLVFDIP